MKDRAVMLPEQLKVFLLDQIEKVKILHDRDLRDGFGEVYLPFALEKKYKHAARELGWQYVFPSDRISNDPRSGKMRRHHIDEGGLQKAVRAAARKVGLTKPVSRIPFATALRRICWKPGMISERFRNFSVIRICLRL